ncbi:uncharacterized protein [Nicotiana sylvestris]|uniref:uncharacterized protein n=1 Tax=Nicotiana sylvestris TaxID=4096 RepID=UPI00388C68E5
MASKETDTGVVDPPREIVESESELQEEVRRLKHQMAEMYQAWIKGHPPPSFPTNYTENPASIPPLSQSQMPNTIDLSPQHAPDAHYYAQEPTFKVPDPYSYTPHEPHVETDKQPKNAEQEEMFRKVQSLEHSLRNMQGLGNQVSVAYKDLCLFPDVQLSVGFKMPKFDLYNRHRDPVAHLRGYCSKMRGAGGKDELLMAYFSQSLSGAALECESFREYEFRWREQAARVNLLMEEDEMVKYFLQAMEPTYYGHLISAIGKSFNDVVNMGEMVEEGLKSSKIMSYSAIKATTQGAFITPIIIRPVTQLPVVDAKAVPWNYKQVIMTYKGKEIEEEVNETGGLTRSGRCFTPEELRKAKPFKDSQMPVKKSVTEEEAEEFLKKMKVLMKILNEAHVPDKITVNHLEKIAGKIFEANRITFSDDELPMEGTEHNRVLYLMCEYLSPVYPAKTEDWHRKNPLEQCVCVRGFDGGGKDSVGDIMLELSIGPVEFTMEFQVLDVDVSYNLLLGRPWIHAAKAVPSSLHQMVKFEWDRQEIVVHGDEDLSACNDTIVSFIDAEDDKGPWVYQTFEIVSVEKIPEGKCIPGPKLSSASVMVANEMLKNGFMLGKGLGSSLQGIVHPVRPSRNPGTFGLGFMPTEKNVKRVKNLKQKVWSLPKPVPHISKSFVKPGIEKPPTSSIPKPVVDVDKELIKRFQSLFEEVNMVEVGEGSSKANVQLVGPNVNLSNWEATPLPTRKEFCYFYASCKYDEEAAFEEISKELKQFEEKPKPNLSETEAINLGDQDDVRETKISVHLEPQIKGEIIKTLFEYKDVFAWSYDDMPGLSTDLVVHKLPTDPAFPPVKKKLRKFKTDMSVKIKEEITKQLTAKVIRVTRYPTWLANVVPIPKKDGKIRVCVDYRDLNKASPKDDFPLPNIHILIDNCAKHEIGEIEVYIDYMIIKSKKQSDYVKDLRKFFQRLRRYNLKLNPAKYAFGVPSGKLLGFVISRHGIELDPSKIKAIQELPPPKNKTERSCVLTRLTMIKKPGWKLFFDGAANMKGVGIEAVLISKTGQHYPVTAQLRFYCTNNMAKYEACILGLRLAIDMGVQEILVLGDSDLLVHQIQGECETRDLKLIPYRQCMHDLCQRFRSVEFRHIPRIHNEIIDALATLASMLHHPDKAYVDPVHIQVHYQHAYCNVVEEEIDGEP